MAAALKSVGLRADEHVELPIKLQFDPSPAITSLGQYYAGLDKLDRELAVETRRATLAVDQKRAVASVRNSAGFWRTVGTIALGLLIGSALLGDECDA